MTLLRVAGVPIRLHGTFLLLVTAWIAIETASGGVSGGLTAVRWIAVLFGSVLWHEGGHAWVAHRHGIRTRAIVLLPVGGAAELETGHVPPRVDVAVSAAGPMASLILGVTTVVGFLALRWDLLAQLAAVNLLLGVFNLIPAFPMDGGRVFRAILVPRLGLTRAHGVAIGVGFAFALAFALIGFGGGVPGLVVLAVVLAALQWRELRHGLPHAAAGYA